MAQHFKSVYLPAILIQKVSIIYGDFFFFFLNTLFALMQLLCTVSGENFRRGMF